MVQDKSAAFKAYDIRGTIGATLDAEMVYDIGRAIVDQTGAKSVAVGADARPSSPELKAAMVKGLMAQGAKVFDLGDTGTEQIYFAAQHMDIDFGVQITASHNPIGDNGMKFIHRGGVPVESAELFAIRDRVVAGVFDAREEGSVEEADIMEPYIDHLLSYIDPLSLSHLKILANPGNGMAGPVVDAIEARLMTMGQNSPFVKMHWPPDASFPHGIPNPLLPENRPPTVEKMRETGADLGVAWDGDFDRCFFFDEKGNFIEGYYIVGLLAEAYLSKTKGGKVVHDPRLIWNTQERAKKAGGEAVQAKVGHAFIKAKMREIDAVYGGEMSAHHYFKEFGYCDSGMIPWLLVAEMVVKSGKSLSTLVEEAQADYPCSGEINYRVKDAPKVLEAILAHFVTQSPEVDREDGVGLSFAHWRANIRTSNTEPLLRLNVESRGDPDLVATMVQEIESIIRQYE